MRQTHLYAICVCVCAEAHLRYLTNSACMPQRKLVALCSIECVFTLPLYHVLELYNRRIWCTLSTGVEDGSTKYEMS